MGYNDWKERTSEFKTIDVRGIQGNFFQGLKKQAMELGGVKGWRSSRHLIRSRCMR